MNVIPSDVGHDIDDSGVDVEEGVGVDEEDALLCDARLALVRIPSSRSLKSLCLRPTCLTHHCSDQDPDRGRDQEIIPILTGLREPLESTRASSS